ncbi:MAG: hypothetical protein ABIG99_01190 [Patescibacteria group bacterium]
MDKIIKYGWWVLIIIPFLFAFGVYVNNGYKTNKPICPVNDIDWDIAVNALSQHFSNLSKENSDVDFGPTDIKKHFSENCEEDLKIYDEYVARNINKETSEYSDPKIMKDAIIYFNKSKEFEKALLLAKEYVTLYPNDIEGWIHRGYAYMGLGNCIEASTDFYHGSVNGNEEASQLLAYVSNSDICKNN